LESADERIESKESGRRKALDLRKRFKYIYNLVHLDEKKEV
jgi:hypothetical protein